MDVFNKLPDVLLVVIISLLPFKDAVGTRMLSKRWRYLYAAITNIVLDFKGVTCENISDLVNDVDRLFSRRKGGYKLFVDKLCIGKIVSRYLKPCPIERWVEAGRWHGMRELEIRTCYTLVMPASLFTSKTLEVLILETGSYSDKKFMPSDLRFVVPAKVSLPNLKHLHLEELTFADNDSLNRLLSSCPALEKLICYLWENDTKITVRSSTLKCLVIKFTCSSPRDCSGSFDIVVDVPNIEMFRYSCNFLTSQSIVVGPYLVYATYDLKLRFKYRSRYIKDAVDVLGSISHARTLNINDTILLVLQAVNIQMPVFGNLTRLIITYCNAGLVALPFLLTRCPSVEVLEFWDVKKWSPDHKTWTLLRESGVTCLRYRVKLIRFVNFEPGKDQIEMVKYFLKSSWELKRMEIYHREEIDDRSLDIIKGLPRSSRECYVKLIQRKD